MHRERVGAVRTRARRIIHARAFNAHANARSRRRSDARLLPLAQTDRALTGSATTVTVTGPVA